MKVTLIGPLPPIKSISPYCFHLSKYLSKKLNLEIFGFKSIKPNILYSGGELEKRTKYEKIKDTKINNYLTWYNPLSWIFVGIKARGDIVHIQHWSIYSTIIYCLISSIARIRNKKIIITIHNITPHEKEKIIILIDRILNKILFKFADGFIIHNNRNKERFEKLYHIDEKNISIISHGPIKPHTPLKGISKIKSRNYLDIPQNKKVILLFGYLWEYKGLDVLLYSLKIIKENVKDLLLIIAGQPLKNWKIYEKIIEEEDLKDFVVMKLKYIHDSEIEYLFSATDLVVLPYKDQPFDTHGGIGALALTFKKPLLVTDVGGLKEYVKDSRVISKPNDKNDLANKIINVLNNGELLKKLSNDSVSIGKELCWEKLIDKTILFYKEKL